jgi:repressor LexA
VRQAQILIFIENFIQQNGYSPTIREIADHMKITPRGAYEHVLALLKKGCIEHQSKKPRTIRKIVKKEGV